MEQRVKILIEFGTTPSSRSRVYIVPHTGPSELDRFVASRGRPGNGNDANSKARFFERRPDHYMSALDRYRRERELTPAEELLERSRRSRDRQPPIDVADTSQDGDEGDEADNESAEG